MASSSSYRSRASSRSQPEESNSAAYAMILLVFALCCFAAALYFNFRAGEVKSFEFTMANRDEVQTLAVEKPDTVYLVEVRQPTNGLAENQDWSAVAVEVLTPTDETLLSFGGEFWRASGYDEGYWSEQKSDYTMKVVFPVAGEYRVGIETESNRETYFNPVSVKFIPKRGSSLPFVVLGVAGLIAGVGIGYFGNRNQVNEAMARYS
jgi:hypothetical protein